MFPHDTTQEKLYGSAIASIVEEVLEGFNCTIFAYGQTGTGKVGWGRGGRGAAEASSTKVAEVATGLAATCSAAFACAASAPRVRALQAAELLAEKARCFCSTDAHHDGRHHGGAVGGRRLVVDYSRASAKASS